MNLIISIKNIVASDAFLTWPNYSAQVYNVHLHRDYDLEIKEDFSTFLKSKQIDTIVLYDHYRERLKEIGFNSYFEDFEKRYEYYGFKLSYSNKRQQRIYRIIK